MTLWVGRIQDSIRSCPAYTSKMGKTSSVSIQAVFGDYRQFQFVSCGCRRWCWQLHGTGLFSRKTQLYQLSSINQIVPSARNNPIVEDILRAACTVLGSSVALSICPLRAGELFKHAITGTTSQAWRIGRAISLCRKGK